jgi:hypothetical protein
MTIRAKFKVIRHLYSIRKEINTEKEPEQRASLGSGSGSFFRKGVREKVFI